jgi:hypothetical protein
VNSPVPDGVSSAYITLASGRCHMYTAKQGWRFDLPG